MSDTEKAQANELELEAQKKQSGFMGEMWQFLRSNKKWWLTPIVVILLGVGILVLLGSSAAAPFIYTLF